MSKGFFSWLERRKMCPPPDYPTISCFFSQASAGNVTIYYPNNPPGISSIKVDDVPITPSKTVYMEAGDHTVDFVIPSGVMPSRIFYNVEMVEAVLTGPWTTFGEENFRGCTSLLNCTLYLPSLTTLSARYTFYGCSALVGEVNFPSLATVEGYGHFQGCSKITKVLSLGSITTIADSMFYNCTSLTDVTLPSTITNFSGQQNFRNCTSLVNCTLYLPNLTTIGGRYTFYGDTKLVGEVDFPSLTSISGYGHFYNTRITKVKDLGSITAIPANFCQNNTALTEATLPSTVTEIGAEAFRSCSSLSTVTIPSGARIATLGDRAFYGTALSEVNYPYLTTLGWESYRTAKITRIVNLGSITSIPSTTFYGCNLLTEATIPSTVTSIGQEAFRSCSALSLLKVLAPTPPTLGLSAFASTPSSLKIYVPNGSGATYQAASGWSDYSSKIYELDSNGNIPT